MNVTPPQKILVAVLDNLGDAVMGSALLEPLRRAYPEASLGFWVKEYAAGVFDLPPSIRVHGADPFWDKAPGRRKGGVAPFFSALKDIREQRYDLAFILNSDWKRAAACWWAGIPERVGQDRRKSALFLTRKVPLRSGVPHVIESHADLLAEWMGAPPPKESLRTEIGLTEAQTREGRRWREDMGWKENRLVVLHLITGDVEKNWPLDSWARLMREASQRWGDLRFAALASPREEAVLREAFKELPKGMVRVFTGSIPEIKPVLAEADLFIGGDSGPGHMAGALGRPVLSLFGPTDPARYRPAGPRVDVIRRMPLKDLPAAEVLEAIADLLTAR